MSETDFFQDLAMLMTVAGVVAAVFSRFKWPKVLGYIAAGILMNEYTWGGSFLSNPNSTYLVGQLGVVFLMFAMGLSLSAREMSRVRYVAIPAAVVDTVVMIWLGYTVGTRCFAWGQTASFFFGVAICDSATTLLVKVIDEMGWSTRPFAKYVLGTSIFEDIICVGAIAVATGFARGGTMSATAFSVSLGWLAVFFLTVLVFGFILVPRLLTSVARRKDDEALELTLLGCCFVVSYFAYRFEFSLALGAFLVGIIAATSDYHAKIDTLVSPLKSMFAAIFFVSIGLLVDPIALLHNLSSVVMVSLLVVMGKATNNFVVSLAMGLDVKTAVQNALALAQIGEFAFMVALLYAGLAGSHDGSLFQIAVGVSLLTTLINPFLLRSSDAVGDFVVHMMPERLLRYQSAYSVWLEKIRANEKDPAFSLLKAAAIKLGVYAVLIFSVSVVCTFLSRVDYSRFSVVFERYSDVFFFVLANVFSIALIPLLIPPARSIGDEISSLLCGAGDSKWQVSLRQTLRFFAVVAVLALFFAEWTMINISIAPRNVLTQWGVFLVIIVTGVVGWRFFVKAGKRATLRFTEALTAEERRTALLQTMVMPVPEGTVSTLVLDAASPAVGMTVVSLNVRAKTGAMVLAVGRAGRMTRNIGPDWEFAVGDVLYIMGDQLQIAALKVLLGIVQQVAEDSHDKS